MTRTLTAIVLIGLLIGACGGDSEVTTTTTGAVETTTTVPQSTSSSTAETTSTSGVDASGGDECIEGEWVLDTDAFIAAVFAELGDSSFGEASAADGSLSVTFNGDGTMTTSRDQWGFVIGSDQGTFKILISGDQTGTWGTEGDLLSISLDEGAPPEITTSLEVDGQEVPLPDSPIEVPSEALAATSTYTCEAGSLTVTSDAFTSTFNRP